mgnify:CR=1 FL=1
MQRDLIVTSSGLRIRDSIESTRELFHGLGVALARKCGGEFIVGTDPRPSSLGALGGFISGIEEGGGICGFLGICPVSAVSYLVSRKPRLHGAMVTASHNPPEWTGLKVFSGDGIIWEERALEDLIREATAYPATPNWRVPSPDEASLKEYVHCAAGELIALGVSGDGLRIVVDTGNGSLSGISRTFLESLGAEVKEINAETDGLFRRPIEPLPENLSMLRREVLSEKADFGIAHDADGNRAALVDERGNVLREDMTLAASLLVLLEKVKSPLVVNFASSSLFESLALKKEAHIFFSEVGERNVLLKMREVGSIVGGEGSCGGVVYTKVSHTRDGLLASGLVAHLVKEEGFLSKALSDYLDFFVSKMAFEYDPSALPFAELVRSLKDQMPGIRYVEMGDVKFIEESGWVLIRASRTQPVLRIVAEARDQRIADRLLLRYASLIRKQLKAD